MASSGGSNGPDIAATPLQPVGNTITVTNQIDTGIDNTVYHAPAYYPTSGNTVSAMPSSPTAAPTLAPANDFRVRIAPLNASIFYGSTSSALGSPMTSGFGSNPFNSGSSGLGSPSPNSGISGTNSALGLPGTATGAANLLSPLVITNGVLFPYSPQIAFQQDVEYNQTDMIQTNMTYEVYKRTPSVTITIAGKFTIQNQTEGQYAMAAIHFFRVASKMYFGTLAGANAGLPPPILLLNGYGTYMFNNLNCILKSHSWNYDEAIDTVSVNVAGGTVRLPCLFTLSITLTVQQTPQQMRSAFNLDAFRTGALMTQGGWI